MRCCLHSLALCLHTFQQPIPSSPMFPSIPTTGSFSKSHVTPHTMFSPESKNGHSQDSISQQVPALHTHFPPKFQGRVAHTGCLCFPSTVQLKFCSHWFFSRLMYGVMQTSSPRPWHSQSRVLLVSFLGHLSIPSLSAEWLPGHPSAQLYLSSCFTACPLPRGFPVLRTVEQLIYARIVLQVSHL